MSAKLRNLVMLGTGLLLAACIAGGGAAKDKVSSANPITGGTIEVTALDAPAALPERPAEQIKTAEEQGGAPPAALAEAKPVLDSGEAAENSAIAAPEAAPVVAEALKTEAQRACEKKGNRWVKAGKSGASACVQQMKDAGKRCVSGKECQGECLARSMTCSPYKPLFGCNEILQDDGVRMTLCID